MSRMTSSLMTIVIVVVLAGCSLNPAGFKPDVATPEWQGAQANTDKIARDWWRTFDSPELNALIETALKNNHELQASLHRVEQARAQLQKANAALLPSASTGGHVSTRKDINNEPVFTAKPGLSVTARERAATAGINYEADLFGANRARKMGARAKLAQQEHAHDAMKLMIMGDVARGYFAVLALQARQRIAAQKLETARDRLDAITAQYHARQTSSAQRVANQERMVAQAKAELAKIREKRELAENALAVLLGMPPQTAQFDKSKLKSLTVPERAVLQPAQLLTRRPDIQAAEARLRQANANIGAARAAFFPEVNLGAGLAAATPVIGNSASTLAMAASLSAPIFEGGRLEGQLSEAEAKKAELLDSYRKIVFVAFREAEDAFARVRSADKLTQNFKESLQKARQAREIAARDSALGHTDVARVLGRRQDVLKAKDRLVQARFDRLAASVDLFRAMGGGWAGAR